jgi:hypothetical protein
MLAKAPARAHPLALFRPLAGLAYPFLANFVVDGAIVLITYWFYRAARPELV